ncbi:MAG: hypothetical protein MJ245_07430 [Clostridia bacterium]|nr:hypothetical protein [Clostridia bacterium]
MEFVRVEAKNEKAGCCEFDVCDIIQEYGVKGYRFCGVIPAVTGPSGKILEQILLFEDTGYTYRYARERVEADNKKTGCSEFRDIEKVVNDAMSGDYSACFGAVPVLMGPSGKILAVELYFALWDD